MIFLRDQTKDKDLTAAMLARNPNFRVLVKGRQVEATKVRLPKTVRRRQVTRTVAEARTLRLLDKVLS